MLRNRADHATAGLRQSYLTPYLLLALCVLHVPALADIDDALRLIEKREYKKALQVLLVAANKGNPQAQYQLGLLYEFGRGTDNDDTKAFHWYGKSANVGNAEAMYRLGRLHHEGKGCDRNLAEAETLYLRAARKGLPAAQYNLGDLLIRQGQPRAAVPWIEKAAEQEFEQAEVTLGYLFAGGEGVPQDLQRALRWYGAAARRGNAYGQVGLGWMYENGLGVEVDYRRAGELYWKAAKQGCAPAELRLGRMHLLGRLPKVYDTAERWLLRADKQSDPEAPFYLGLIREKRDSDPEAAMRWFEIGAKRGDPLAQYKVAVSQLQEARKDKVQGYAWLVVAAEQGHKKAERHLVALKGRLSKDELKNASELAATLPRIIRRPPN